MGYQQDESVALVAAVTNEVTALIALEFHLKLMIPSGGPNFAPYLRWAPAIGMSGNRSILSVPTPDWRAWGLSEGSKARARGVRELAAVCGICRGSWAFMWTHDP